MGKLAGFRISQNQEMTKIYRKQAGSKKRF
jgi:hypothetical protein